MSEIAYVVRAMRLDDYAVVQLLTNIDAAVEQEVEIAGVGNGFNDSGTIVVAFPQYQFIGVADDGSWMFDTTTPVANQVMYQNVGDNVSYYAVDPYGTLEWNPVCTWITGTDISNYLQIPLTSSGAATLLTQCASAANNFAYRRRLEAGYLTDELTVVPGGDVKLGTIMVGAAYFRQQGSFTSLASFDGMGAPPSTGLSPMVMQLLGINRPQVA
jgi:hypothetical protein